MTDLVQPVETQEPATPKTPEPTQAPTGQGQEKPQEQPKYVTQEQLDSAVADAVRNVKMADKQRAKQIKQEIATLKGRLEKAGLQVTPQQEEQLESEIISSYSDDDEEPGAQPQSADDIPPHAQAAIEMMADADTYIEEGDPEFETYIKPHLSQPGPALLRATSQAIDAKQARTLQNKEKAPLRTPAGGQAEGPGEFKAKDARQLWTRAHPSK